MARIFLDANESRNGAFANNDIVFGNTGTETVSINSGATNVRVEGTVEAVTLAGIPSDFTYRSEGNNLVVFRAGTQVARIIVQDDASGTVINFNNGSASANVGAGGITLGGASVSATQGAVSPTLTPIDNTPQLTAALEDLSTAEASATAALRAAAAADDDAPATTPAAAYETYLNGYTAAEASTELSEARNTLFTEQQQALTASQNLSGARSARSDAALQQDLATALAAPAVQNDAPAQTALQARATANANLETDFAVDGSNQQLLTSLRTAIANYVAAGGDTTATVSAAGAPNVTVADVLDDINLVLNVTTVDQDDVNDAVDAIGEYTGFTPAAGAAASVTAFDRALDTVIERDNLTEAAETAQTNVENLDVLNGVQAAEAAIDARSALVNADAAAQTELSEAQAYFDQFSGLVSNITAANQAVTDANDAFGTLGFETPVTVGGAAENGTLQDDIFVVEAGENGTINSFSTLGDDVLYVGQGYSVVSVAADVNVLTTAVGSAANLEVFVKQVGANTQIYVEDQAFNGSEIDGSFDGAVITLTNVNAANLTFSNGYFSIA